MAVGRQKCKFGLGAYLKSPGSPVGVSLATVFSAERVEKTATCPDRPTTGRPCCGWEPYFSGQKNPSATPLGALGAVLTDRAMAFAGKAREISAPSRSEIQRRSLRPPCRGPWWTTRGIGNRFGRPKQQDHEFSRIAGRLQWIFFGVPAYSAEWFQVVYFYLVAI